MVKAERQVFLMRKISKALLGIGNEFFIYINRFLSNMNILEKL